MYSMGGWIIRPMSCNNGFKSLPSMAAGNNRSKGFEVNSMNNRNPTEIKPITPSTRATISSGKCLLNPATAAVHTVRINAHNSSEPSWPPHTAATRKWMGSCELECCATYNTEKSLATKDMTRQAKAIETKKNCPKANGLAVFINSKLPLVAPVMGKTP